MEDSPRFFCIHLFLYPMRAWTAACCLLMCVRCAVYNVSSDSGQLGTILSRASSGDVIVAGPGVHRGSAISVARPNIELRGSAGSTVVALTGTFLVVGANFIVDGVTFADGTRGCMSILGSGAVLRNSVFVNCVSSGSGAAVAVGGAARTTLFQNVTILRCRGNIGAVFLAGAGTVRFVDSTWVNNTGVNGAAIYASQTAVILNGTNVFENNQAASSGGAVYIQSGSVVVAGATLFVRNRAGGLGGAVYALAGSVVVSEASVLTNNWAAVSGGAVYSQSGSVSVVDDAVCASNVAASGSGGCVFSVADVSLSGRAKIGRNSAGASGGGVFASRLRCAGQVVVELNTAGNGGGVFVASFGSISGFVSFVSNTAAESGGGLAAKDVNGLEIGDSTRFVRNAATQGGGVYVESGRGVQLAGYAGFSNNTAGNGGGMACSTSTVSMTGNVSFELNKASKLGGGLYISDCVLAAGGQASFRRNAAFQGAGVFGMASTARLFDDVGAWRFFFFSAFRSA